MTTGQEDPPVEAGESMEFGSLRIAFDDRVLRPRPWTIAQSYWAADLLGEVPDGPVLELCAGAGQIGLLAVHGSERRIVCVDLDPAAVELTRRNATDAGMGERVETRIGRIQDAIGQDERFALVVADPPWVPRARVTEFPEDPVVAIDGGDEGLDVARSCLTAIGAHLSPGGACVLQLGTSAQVETLSGELAEAGLSVHEIREYGAAGVLVRLDRA